VRSLLVGDDRGGGGGTSGRSSLGFGGDAHILSPVSSPFCAEILPFLSFLLESIGVHGFPLLPSSQ
jgi:hypothetical protein